MGLRPSSHTFSEFPYMYVLVFLYHRGMLNTPTKKKQGAQMLTVTADIRPQAYWYAAGRLDNDLDYPYSTSDLADFADHYTALYAKFLNSTGSMPMFYTVFNEWKAAQK